jgi:hypothetical protein
MNVIQLTSNAPGAQFFWPNLAGVKVLPGMALEYVEYFTCPVSAAAVSEVSAALHVGTDTITLKDTTGRDGAVVSVEAGRARAGRWRRVIIDLKPHVGKVLNEFSVSIGARLAAPTVYPVTLQIAELTLTRYRAPYALGWRSAQTVPTGAVLTRRELDEFPLIVEEATSIEDPVEDITFVRALAGNARGRVTHDRMRNEWSLSVAPLTAEQVADFFTFWWLYREEPCLYQFEPGEPPRLALFRARPTKREIDNDTALVYRVQCQLGEA